MLRAKSPFAPTRRHLKKYSVMLGLKDSTGKLIVKKHLTDYVAQDSGKNFGYSVTLLLEMTGR